MNAHLLDEMVHFSQFILSLFIVFYTFLPFSLAYGRKPCCKLFSPIRRSDCGYIFIPSSVLSILIPMRPQATLP